MSHTCNCKTLAVVSASKNSRPVLSLANCTADIASIQTVLLIGSLKDLNAHFAEWRLLLSMLKNQKL